jgi:hypothetical protein
LKATNVHNSSAQFPWVGWLLSKVHSKFFQYFKTNHRVVEDGNQVCLERTL